MSKTSTAGKPATSDQSATNVIAYAFERGPVREVVVTEEETKAIREFLAGPTPEAPNLRAAMERAKRFKFIVK